jgi:hypothetical protein
MIRCKKKDSKASGKTTLKKILAFTSNINFINLKFLQKNNSLTEIKIFILNNLN